MSFTLHGIGVSGGIAIGRAHLVSHATLEVSHYVVPLYQVPEESARFDAAVRKVRAEFTDLHTEIPEGAPAEFSAFVNLHQMILDDATLSVEPRRIIETEQCNAEWALKVQTDVLLAQFDAIEDTYLRERRNDVIQVVERVLRALSGAPGYAPPPVTDSEHELILVAHDQTILTMNDPARRLLDTADSCYVRDGRFHCKMNESAARLRDVISAFSSQRSPQERVPTRDRMAFRIHGPDGSPVWCSAWDMRPELVLGLFGPVAAVLLILTPQQSSQPADSLWLGSMFDLTPTEARVASALMTGVDLESIAAQHQVSLGTVRTQLRSIYEKTGTHRQAQLVALLHAAGNA